MRLAPTDWRGNALGALADAGEEIAAATEPTIAIIITVSEADLLGDRPVSFYSNLSMPALGPILTYCGVRIADRLRTNG
jgi:hypothetical protein